MFDWAKFCLTKGAVKLHLLLDHDGYLPYLAVISEGKKHEVRVARQIQFAPGAILVFDRGYTDHEWFTNLTQQAVYFVTPLKENADCARQSMLLIRLSLSCVSHYGFAWSSGLTVPFLFPTGRGRCRDAASLRVRKISVVC